MLFVVVRIQFSCSVTCVHHKLRATRSYFGHLATRISRKSPYTGGATGPVERHMEALATVGLRLHELHEANNKTGYMGVYHNPSSKLAKPYQAQVSRGGKDVHLGRFATAEEAALCVAQTPEGQRRAAAAPPLTSEELC